MPFTLRPGLSWCVCADQAVFLDLQRNRYFCLPEMPDGLFRRWATGETLAPEALTLLAACGVIEAGEGAAPAAACQPAATQDYALHAVRSGATAAVAGAIVGQLRAQCWLKLRPMRDIAARLASEHAMPGRAPDALLQRQVARAFAASAMLLRAADQCLPRAIAARRLCQRYGQAAALVFGVRLNPFAAHAWVQCDDAIIVGDLEHVRLYTPILVLP